jgi:hypothetical protein
LRVNWPNETEVQRKKKTRNKNRSISWEAARSVEAAKVGVIFELLFFDYHKKDLLFKTCFMNKKFKFQNLVEH